MQLPRRQWFLLRHRLFRFELTPFFQQTLFFDKSVGRRVREGLTQTMKDGKHIFSLEVAMDIFTRAGIPDFVDLVLNRIHRPVCSLN